MGAPFFVPLDSRFERGTDLIIARGPRALQLARVVGDEPRNDSRGVCGHLVCRYQRRAGRWSRCHVLIWAPQVVRVATSADRTLYGPPLEAIA